MRNEFDEGEVIRGSRAGTAKPREGVLSPTVVANDLWAEDVRKWGLLVVSPHNIPFLF